jgi:hypothetical protein
MLGLTLGSIDHRALCAIIAQIGAARLVSDPAPAYLSLRPPDDFERQPP